ncbi:MAG: cation:proton antiporter, partial [Acidobacteriota bacterium]
LVTRYLSPLLLRRIVLTRNKELFVIASLWMLLVIALGVSAAGFSLALGAFLAGLMLSESEYADQIFADMRPFRDGLNSLFFISIGMLVDPAFLWSHKGLVLTVVGAVLIGKAAINLLTVLAWGFPVQIAVLVGFGLAQVGEFSFVLLEAGFRSGLIPADGYQIAISCAVATMTLTPALAWGSRHLASSSRLLSLSRTLRRKNRFRNLEAAADQLGDHALVCGFGVGGRSIARVLKANRIRYLVLELNAQTIQQEKARGEPIHFGDCTDSDILARAGAKEARVAIFCLSDPFATRQAVRTARSLNPNLIVLTRTHYASEIDELFDLGSNEVVADEFETSIELIARVLRLYNFPRNLVAAEIRSIREERYQLFRRQEITVPRFRLTGSLDVFFETHHVSVDSPLCGVSIAGSRIREQTGALVLGIVRESGGVANPGPDELLQAGDLLFLSGTKSQLRQAESLLLADPG